MRPPLLSAIAGDPEIEALLSDEAQLEAMLRFEVALAQAEAEVGLIDAASAAAIAAAADNFVLDWQGLFAGMTQDGVVVPALIRQLRAAVPSQHRADLHRGATSQDVLDTALMLQLARIIPLLRARIAELRTRLASLVKQHGASRLMAHTRMQSALPFTMADKLRTWDEPLQRHEATLARASPDLLVVQLGGPIGDRSSFEGHGGPIAEGIAKRLGLATAPAWHSGRDRIVALGSLLAMLTGSLGKLGADVALMAQTEVGAVTLTDGGSSSAMSHKSNPVNAEILVALARRSAGLAGTLGQAMVHEGERSGSAWTLEWLTLPDLIVTTGAALNLAIRLTGQLTLRDTAAS